MRRTPWRPRPVAPAAARTSLALAPLFRRRARARCDRTHAAACTVGLTKLRTAAPPRCPSPCHAAPAAATHHSSDGPCPSDSCTPSSGLGTATILPLTASAGTGSAGASAGQLLHPQAVPHAAGRQPQAGVAWPAQLMPGGMPSMPQMHPQLGMVQLVPVPAGMPLGVMAAGKQPPLPNGQNGKAKASSQRQATNREAQKRYRRAHGAGRVARLHVRCGCSACGGAWACSPLRRLPACLPAALQQGAAACCQPQSTVAGSGRRFGCWRCR